ncbi:MAG: DEAD/DEAH box helicase [Armatimonadota bacterium]
MSTQWWHEDAPPAGLLERWLAPPPPSPPATLLHLPAPVQRGAAQAETIPGAPPAVMARDARPQIDTPVRQCGFVRRWPTRAVDLLRLLYPPPPAAPRTDAAGAGTAGEPAGIAERVSQARMQRDALARRLLAVLQPPPETLLRADGPLAWPHPFFPFQRLGVQVLLHAPCLLLSDEMGLGKTVQAIATLRVLCYRRELARALIVAPASLLTQWQREIARWAPELRVMTVYGDAHERRWQWQYRAHLTLTSYETLRADAGGNARFGPWGETWDVVVLDEAQRIKNRQVEISRICKRLPRRRAWALTGTPLENRSDDVASLLEFVTGAPAPTEGPALRALLNQYQLRRRKADVLADLPPKLITDLALPMTPAQRRAYDRAACEGIVQLREMGEARVEHVLALITRLKQLCNFSPDGESAKLDDLRLRLEELTAEGHRALVFTQFIDEAAGARRIAERLRRFSPLVFTGELSLLERRDLVDRFQRGEHGVMILSLRAGGQGLNLQCASYVFHFDRWWNPAVERQAEDRTHRIGQSQPVHVYRYVMADTIEQRIHDLLQRKVDLFTRLIDTASLDLSSFLTKDDLFEIIDL